MSTLLNFYMATEISSVTDRLLIALPEGDWSAIATMPLAELVTEMLEIVRAIDLKRYRNSIRSPKKPTPKKQHQRNKVHVSVSKLLAERK